MKVKTIDTLQLRVDAVSGSGAAVIKTQSLMHCPWTRYSRDNPPGSGYCEDQGVRIERWTEWRLWGLLLWRRREVVRELMPHEWISSATLGSEQ